MKKKTRRLFSAGLGIAMAAMIGLALWQAWGYYQAAATADYARQIAGVPGHTAEQKTTAPGEAPATAPEMTQPETPDHNIGAAAQLPLDPELSYLLALDIAALQGENPDVLGWIHVPGTQISYPLVQGEDNQQYLRRSWQGKRSSAGSIFMECQNNPNFLDYNTILYGHNMRSGACFADLTKYREQSYQQEHPCVYIVTSRDVRRYQIFAAYEAQLQSHTYRLQFSQEKTRQAALDYYLQSSLWQTEQRPGIQDYLLTLSTCTGTGTYDTRWVVQGYLTGIWVR